MNTLQTMRGGETFPGPWRIWPGARDTALTEMARQQADVPTLQLKGAEKHAELLAEKQALLIGLGAVNGRVMERLAQSGVGRIIGADADRYELVSCWTQPCTAADAGRLKAVVQGERAAAAGPRASILTAATVAQNLPYQLLWDSDVWIAAADNLEVLVWAGTLAAAMGKPLLQGAVFGEQWLAIVRHWDLRQAEHPCPGCQLSRAQWGTLRNRAGCDPGLSQAAQVESTRTLPSVCALAAEMLASKSLAFLVDRAPGLTPSEEWMHAAATSRFFSTELARNVDCRCPHRRWQRVNVPCRTSDVTLEQLASHLGKKARQALGTPRMTVRAEIPWATQAVDSGNNLAPSQRFARWNSQWVHQGETYRAVPPCMRSTLPTADVQAVRHMPLSALGLPSGAGIALEFEECSTWFFAGNVLLETQTTPRTFESKPRLVWHEDNAKDLPAERSLVSGNP